MRKWWWFCLWISMVLAHLLSPSFIDFHVWPAVKHHFRFLDKLYSIFHKPHHLAINKDGQHVLSKDGPHVDPPVIYEDLKRQKIMVVRNFITSLNLLVGTSWRLIFIRPIVASLSRIGGRVSKIHQSLPLCPRQFLGSVIWSATARQITWGSDVVDIGTVGPQRSRRTTRSSYHL